MATLKPLFNLGGGGGGNVELDTTLTQSGKAADAKAVGDKFNNYPTKIEMENATIRPLYKVSDNNLMVSYNNGVTYDFACALPVSSGGSSSGGSSGGISVKIVSFNNRPDFYDWMRFNVGKVLKITVSSAMALTPFVFTNVIPYKDGQDNDAFSLISLDTGFVDGNVDMFVYTMRVTSELITIESGSVGAECTETEIPDEFVGFMNLVINIYYLDLEV